MEEIEQNKKWQLIMMWTRPEATHVEKSEYEVIDGDIDAAEEIDAAMDNLYTWSVRRGCDIVRTESPTYYV